MTETDKKAPLATSEAGTSVVRRPGGKPLTIAGSSNLIAGGLLGIFAITKRGLPGLFAAGVGAGLLYRGAKDNGIFDGSWLPRLLNTANSQLVPFERQVIVDRNPQVVYEFWRNPENLAVFMPRIRDAAPVGDDLSRWQLRLTDELRLQWTAELIKDEPNRFLAWRTTADSDIQHQGTVGFEPLRDEQSTRLTIRLEILAPGGRVGALFMKWLEEMPVRFFSTELQRVRTILESSAYDPKTTPDS